MKMAAIVYLYKKAKGMGLSLRLTFKDKEYVYQIIDTKHINHKLTEINLLLNGEKIDLVKAANLVWKTKDQHFEFDSELAQALGRSVSLRLRM